MIKALVTSLLVSAALPVCAQQILSGKYTITGSVKNIKGAKMALLRYSQDNQRIDDSAIIVNGRFTFTGQLIEPVSATIFLKKAETDTTEMRSFYSRNTLYFYLAPGKTTISASDSLKYAPYKATSPYTAEFAALNDSVRIFRQTYMEPLAMLYPKYKGDSTKLKELQVLSAQYMKKQQEGYRKFVEEHPASPVSLFAFDRYTGLLLNEQHEPLFLSLSPAVRALPSGKNFESRFQKMHATAVGKTAPDFALANVSGDTVKLSSFRGKYVLLDFWASWCKPCRSENPFVAAAYSAYNTKGFEVLSVSLDRENAIAAWKHAIEQDGMHWTNVIDLKTGDLSPSKTYGITSIPKNYLIDPAGKIVAINLRGEELQLKLKELLSIE